jgi:hypothetical protein
VQRSVRLLLLPPFSFPEEARLLGSAAPTTLLRYQVSGTRRIHQMDYYWTSPACSELPRTLFMRSSRTASGRTSGSVKLHSSITALGQQGTEPDLRIYAVVHRCEVVVHKFASFSEGGKSRLFRLDVLVPVYRVQRTDERTRTADPISLRVCGQG